MTRSEVLVAREVGEIWDEAPVWPGGCRTRLLEGEEPLPSSKRVVALIPLLSRPIGWAEMEKLPGLRIVANYAVGVDNIDLSAAAARGIIVTNTPGVLTEATADLTWALLLASARRLREGLELTLSGRWGGWEPGQLLGLDLQGRNLGILGAGRIGAAVARRAAGFGLRVVYWSRRASSVLETEVGASRIPTLSEILEESDIVSVHLPLTRSTQGLLGPEELARMKKGSILVNTARGEIVDLDALAEALRDGPVAAAGLDVYPEEPCIPAELRAMPNAALLPHLGSATLRARQAMWQLARDNVRRVLAGEAPLTPVG
ncbi:MAG: 2-hydroxyacid dehydrogenase [Gemmatimonadota bacterium]